MGVEVVDSKLSHVPVDTGGEENGTINQAVGLHESIKFGSHGADEPVKGEVNKVSEAHFPKDAVDEWPAPKQVHSFFFVKYRSFEDQKIKSKLELADKELQKKNQLRSQLIDKLRAKKSERAQVVSHIRAHAEEKRQYWNKIDEKKKEMEPLKYALGQLRGTNNGGKEGRAGLFSSEAALNDYIKSLHYRIHHESIPLTEEKQILREIKELEGVRPQVIENEAERAKIQESMGEREALQVQVKLIGDDRTGVWKEQLVVKAKLKQLEDEKLTKEKEIKAVEEELTAVTQKRDQTFENIQQLRKQREEGNSSFYENRSLLNKAKELAAKKDVEALKDLSETEVNKFISFWSSNKSFRDDYEMRILQSLDMRQLSKDGRMRNPDEKPLLAVEASTSVAAEVVPRTTVKQQDKHIKQEKEDSSPPQTDASSIQKGQKEKQQQKEATTKKKQTAAKAGEVEVEDEEEFYVPEKLQKDSSKTSKVDELKLKEMKRVQELAKAKLAMERKKKLAEKAAAKAELKKQKEAEKKEKEREKRLKKKAGASAAATAHSETEEQPEEAEEVTEPEKAEEAVESQAPPKNKDRKENAIKYRKRSKGPDSLPRTILKRKKVTNYWMWAAAPAALALVLLLIVGYNYYLV